MSHPSRENNSKKRREERGDVFRNNSNNKEILKNQNVPIIISTSINPNPSTTPSG